MKDWHEESGGITSEQNVMMEESHESETDDASDHHHLETAAPLAQEFPDSISICSDDESVCVLEILQERQLGLDALVAKAKKMGKNRPKGSLLRQYVDNATRL